MRKKAAAVLAGVVFILAAAGSVQAMTTSIDLGSAGEGRGSVIWFFTNESNTVEDVECEQAQDAVMGEATLTESGMIMEYGDFSEIRGLSEEEKKKFLDWHKEEMRNQLAYLEPYGVTYDGEADKILYQGKTVRWLIDRQVDDTCMAVEMPEGEIDLYTVRARDYKLTGVRIAAKEEYEERTKNGFNGFECRQECDVCEAIAEESCLETEKECEESRQKIREYKAAGIDLDETNGAWLWQNQPIYLLADENGSLYQNGSEETLGSKIYVIVKRNRDGSIKEAKQVTMEEVLKEKMLQKQ